MADTVRGSDAAYQSHDCPHLSVRHTLENNKEAVPKAKKNQDASSFSQDARLVPESLLEGRDGTNPGRAAVLWKDDVR